MLNCTDLKIINETASVKRHGCIAMLLYTIGLTKKWGKNNVNRISDIYKALISGI